MLADFKDCEVDALVPEGGAGLRHAAECVEGEASDGLELAVGGKSQAEAFVDLFERERCIGLVERTAERDHGVGWSGQVVLVVDRPTMCSSRSSSVIRRSEERR